MILSPFSVVETATVRFYLSLALLVLLSLLAGPLSAALIAIESQAMRPDRLFLMDETTGDVSFLTDLQDELSSFPGLSFLEDERFLANFFPGGINPSLATVDTSDGSVSVVVPLSSRGGRASNESENVLYTIDDDSGNRLTAEFGRLGLDRFNLRPRTHHPPAPGPSLSGAGVCEVKKPVC